jgi:1-phosphofructokinase family hexose kinase
MIVCVTPNAALDRTLHIPGFSTEGIFRPKQVIVNAGGKGINVARAIQILGGEAQCCGFLGGQTGGQIAALVEADGIKTRWTYIAEGESRICMIIVDPEQATSAVINESGPTVGETDWARLQQDILESSESLNTVCFCGSLPLSPPLDKFRALLVDLVEKGCRVWVDTSGDALAAAATLPGVSLKINVEEASVLLQQPIETLDDAWAAADILCQQVAAPVILTRGSEGAILSSASRRWSAEPPPIKLASTVGSGDSFLAGLLVALEHGAPAPEALRNGVAAGAANAQSLGGARFSRESFNQLLALTKVHTLS